MGIGEYSPCVASRECIPQQGAMGLGPNPKGGPLPRKVGGPLPMAQRGGKGGQGQTDQCQSPGPRGPDGTPL